MVAAAAEAGAAAGSRAGHRRAMAQLGARGPFTVLEPAVDATGLNRPGAALDAGAPEVSRGPSNAVGPGALQSSAYRNFTRRGEAPWGLTSQLGTVSTTTGSKGLVMDKKTCMAVGMGGRCVQGCQGARVQGCQGARMPGCQDARVLGCQGVRMPG